MKRSAIEPNGLGYVPHANDEIQLQFFILRSRLKNTLATITLMVLRRCRCQSYETCAKESSVNNDLVMSVLCATRSSQSRIFRVYVQRSVP
jgi:hypothetical protein